MGKPRGPQVQFGPDVRQQIGDLRRVCQMSLSEIAEALGVSRRQVHRWDKGYSLSVDKPTLCISKKLADKIGRLHARVMAKMGVPR